MRKMRATALLLLASCGVLEIDVDVYKGPLVNEKDVQLGQVSILAVAARPLLIGLRDRLEFWPAPLEETGDRPRAGVVYRRAWTEEERLIEFHRRIAQARDENWYREGYIPRGGDLLQKEQARHVNAILGLYEDKSGTEFSGLLQTIGNRLVHFDRVYEKLHTKSGTTEGWRTNLEQSFYKGDDISSHPILKKPDLQDPLRVEQWKKEVAAAVLALADGYVHFFKPGGYRGKNSSMPLKLVEPHNRLIELFTENPEAQASYRLGRSMVAASANDQFDALALETTVDAHFRLISRADVPASDRESRVKRAIELCRAFIDCRQNLSDALEVLLELLPALSADVPMLKQDTRLTAQKHVARLISYIVRPERLANAITHPKCPPEVTRNMSSFKIELGERVDRAEKSPWVILLSNNVKAAGPNQLMNILGGQLGGREEYQLEDALEVLGREAVEETLIKDGIVFGSALLKAHLWYKRLENRPDTRFGLVRGPTNTRPERDAMEASRQILADLVGMLGSIGLERGRLSDGLDTLIENFLNISDRPHSDETVRHSRERLLGALVRFAEILNFLGNNTELISPGTIKRSIGSGQESAANYVQTLQAVGNSILIHIDEIRHREAADQKNDGGRGGAVELHALRSARSSTPAEVVDRLSTDLTLEGERLASLKDPLAEGFKEAGKAVRDARADILKRVEPPAAGWTPAAVLDVAIDILRKRAEVAESNSTNFNKGAGALEGPGKKYVDGLVSAEQARKAVWSQDKLPRGPRRALEDVADAVAKSVDLLTPDAAWPVVVKALESREDALQEAARRDGPASDAAERAAAFTEWVKALGVPGETYVRGLVTLERAREEVAALSGLTKDAAKVLEALKAPVRGIADLLTRDKAWERLLAEAEKLKKNLETKKTAAVNAAKEANEFKKGAEALKVIGDRYVTHATAEEARAAVFSLANLAGQSALNDVKEAVKTQKGTRQESWGFVEAALKDRLKKLDDAAKAPNASPAAATDVKKLQDAIDGLKVPAETYLKDGPGKCFKAEDIRLALSKLPDLSEESKKVLYLVEDEVKKLTDLIIQEAAWVLVWKEVAKRQETLVKAAEAVLDAPAAAEAFKQGMADLEEPGKKYVKTGGNKDLTAEDARAAVAELPKLAKEIVDALETVKGAVGKLTEKGTREDAWKRVQDEVKKHKEMQEKTAAAARSALEVIRTFPRPGLPEPDPNGKPRTAKDVLDGLIAGLRYEHIEASKQSSGRADKVKKAIDLALEYRSGMVYIRPPSVYLRSSFPAPTLQRDGATTWRNMVMEHGCRSMPFLPKPEGNQLQKEIDKQFWQSINKVRVAGGGNVNYVVAKDDIGNWYVKNYSSDPAVIFKSAKNLALFGIGAKLDQNLLATDPTKKPLDVQTTGKQEEHKGALEKRFEKLSTEFEAEAVKHNETFVESGNVAKSDAKTRFASNEDVKPYADVLAETLTKPQEAFDAKAKEIQDRVKEPGKEADKLAKKDLPAPDASMELLRAGRRLMRDSLAALEAAKPEKAGEADPEKARATARKLYSALLRERLESFLENRREATGRHESTVSLLGELATD